MPQEIDIRAMLLRQEAKAKRALDDAKLLGAIPGREESIEYAEERYATACAVRFNWEAREATASPENRSCSCQHSIVCGAYNVDTSKCALHGAK